MSERIEDKLRRRIEHAIQDAGFTEFRIHFLRDGLLRLGPRALTELLSILEELSARAVEAGGTRGQGRLW